MQQFVSKHLFKSVKDMSQDQMNDLLAKVFGAFQQWEALPSCEQVAVIQQQQEEQRQRARNAALAAKVRHAAQGSVGR